MAIERTDRARRRMTAGTAAAVITAAVAVAAPAVASAEELVIATFGGSFAEDTKTCHIAAFEKATGATVAMKVGSSVQHAAAIRAMGGRSQFDVAYMDDLLATQLANEKLLSEIDTAKLGNAPDLIPGAIPDNKRFVVFMLGATALAYNPEMMPEPPTSWTDLADPKWKGKIALGDVTGTSGMQFLLAMNRMHGGTIDNIDPGIAALKELAPSAVTFYTQADQIVSLFERGEIAMAPWYPDRVGSAADKGVKVAVAYPKEGAVGIRPTLSIPEGAPHADLAHKFIDVVLSPEGQACFAERKYAGPVNTKVDLSDKVAKIVPTGEARDNLWFPDPQTVASNMPDWIRRWQREVTR